MWGKFFDETKLDVKWENYLKNIDKNNRDKYPTTISDLNDLIRVAYLLKDDCIKSLGKYFSNSKLDAYYL